MRRLKITHLTEYRFPVPVELQPHRLLIRPREGPEVHIESSALSIAPAHQVTWHRDALDNATGVVSFQEPAATLSINSEVIIQHYGEAPLDFLVEDYAVDYPFHYIPRDRADLFPFLQPVYPGDETAISDWLASLGLSRPNLQTYALLDRLCKTIAGQFRYAPRDAPGVQSPSATLQLAGGSCRDYAALFMETCRYLGLASRFVSGYGHLPGSEQWSTTTHAWAETYLPGAGWKGFDPTCGEVTGSRHIPVAVARHPEAVPPVAGSFVGPGGTLPQLIVDVRVMAL